MWQDDLEQLTTELDKYEARERDEESTAQLKAFKAGVSQKAGQAASGAQRKAAAANSRSNKLEYMPAEVSGVLKIYQV